MYLISFDLSTHTGYAVFKGDELIEYGLLETKISNNKGNIKSYKDLPSEFPLNFFAATKSIVDQCLTIVDKYPNSKVVTEFTEQSKFRMSQKFLEWLHYEFIVAIREKNLELKFLLNSDWRKQVKCYLKHHPDLAEYNKKVAKAKREATPNKVGARVAKIDGKIVAKVNQKKLSIIIANEKYNLEIKDDNIADAINVGRAAIELGL